MKKEEQIAHPCFVSFLLRCFTNHTFTFHVIKATTLLFKKSFCFQFALFYNYIIYQMENFKFCVNKSVFGTHIRKNQQICVKNIKMKIKQNGYIYFSEYSYLQNQVPGTSYSDSELLIIRHKIKSKSCQSLINGMLQSMKKRKISHLIFQNNPINEIFGQTKIKRWADFIQEG